MGGKVRYVMRKHPKCYSKFWIGVVGNKASGCKCIQNQNLKQDQLDAECKERKNQELQIDKVERFSPKKNWCYLCFIKSRIASLSTSKHLGHGYQKHTEQAEAVLSLLEKNANLEGSPDPQIFDLAERLNSLLEAWNLRVYKENRSKQASSISNSLLLESKHGVACNDPAYFLDTYRYNVAKSVRPEYQALMRWYCEIWPAEMNDIVNDITLLASRRKGQKSANRTEENFQLVIHEANKIWQRERRENKPITQIGPMSDRLTKSSASWSHNGKVIPAKTIRNYLSRWEAAPAEAFRTGCPRKK